MVQQMKSGSVIVDVSIDNGGCFETSQITSHQEPVYTIHNVIHYCVPNIPSAVSRTASNAISNILMPIVLACNEISGGAELMVQSKPGLLSATYVFKGKLTSKVLAKKFDLKYTDLNLIISSQL
jgi:alanine dehydrogenase